MKKGFNNKSAFTLAELLVAVFVLSIVITSFLSVMVVSSMLLSVSESQSLALGNAQSKMEEIRNVEFDSILSTYNGDTFTPGEPSGSSGSITVAEVGSDDASELLKVDITISWQNRDGRNLTNSLSSLIANK